MPVWQILENGEQGLSIVVPSSIHIIQRIELMLTPGTRNQVKPSKHPLSTKRNAQCGDEGMFLYVPPVGRLEKKGSLDTPCVKEKLSHDRMKSGKTGTQISQAWYNLWDCYLFHATLRGRAWDHLKT
uniref:Serine/threonine-protein kinase ATG1 n=1 Tax=Anthurium amnicola TaxID=1678845 RepID=A0A1D1XET2_9ARAE